MNLFNEHTQGEQRQTLADFLPNGFSFVAKNIIDTVLFDFLNGLSPSLVEAEQIMNLIISELDPLTTTLLIDSWEAAVGIPDDCFNNVNVPINVRRNQVFLKLAMQIDTRFSWYQIADILGISPINIKQLLDDNPYRFPLNFPWNFESYNIARFTIVVELPQNLVSDTFGQMIFPFPFGTRTKSIIECFFRKIRPAYCNIVFNYIL